MQFFSDSFDHLNISCSIPCSPAHQRNDPNSHLGTFSFVEESSVLALANQDPSSLELSNDEFSSSIADSSFTGEESVLDYFDTGSMGPEQGSNIALPAYPLDMMSSSLESTSGLDSVDEFLDHSSTDCLSDFTVSSEPVDYSGDVSVPLEFGMDFSEMADPSERWVEAFKEMPLEYSSCDCIEPNGYSCANNSSDSDGTEGSRVSRGSDYCSSHSDSEQYHDSLRSDVMIPSTFSNQHTAPSTPLFLAQREVCSSMGMEGYVNPVPYVFPSGGDSLPEQVNSEMSQEPNSFFNVAADNCLLPCTLSTDETVCTTSENFENFENFENVRFLLERDP